MHVCPNVLAPGVRTAGPIETEEGPLGAAERRKDDGANHRATSTTWHVLRATVQTLAKKTI